MEVAVGIGVDLVGSRVQEAHRSWVEVARNQESQDLDQDRSHREVDQTLAHSAEEEGSSH